MGFWLWRLYLEISALQGHNGHITNEEVVVPVFKKIMDASDGNHN